MFVTGFSEFSDTKICFTYSKRVLLQCTPIHDSVHLSDPWFHWISVPYMGKHHCHLGLACITRDGFFQPVNPVTLSPHLTSILSMTNKPQSAESMDGNNITSNLIHNASYSNFTTVPSTGEDPRILATSHIMYKIGLCGNKIDAIIKSVGFHVILTRTGLVSQLTPDVKVTIFSGTEWCNSRQELQ